MNKRRRRSESREGIREAVSAGLIGIFILSVLATMAVPSVLGGGGGPILPTTFYGNVTVNGVDAPVDTIVTGRIVDREGEPGNGSIYVEEPGKYGNETKHDFLVISTDDRDEGKTIEFYVKRPSDTVEIKADQNATFDSNIHPHKLDLTVTIGDTEAPVVTNPDATPQIIPEDTDNEPRWGELANLSVVVTDESTITSVTINLSAIGGSATQAMTPTSDNIWYYETNASIDSAIFEAGSYVPHQLQVNATDVTGKSNTSVSIELLVMKNGDVNEDGSVLFSDVTYLGNYVVGTLGYDIQEGICDVNGDESVLFSDVTYLGNHVLDILGYGILK